MKLKLSDKALEALALDAIETAKKRGLRLKKKKQKQNNKA